MAMPKKEKECQGVLGVLTSSPVRASLNPAENIEVLAVVHSSVLDISRCTLV
jgi:hypothetical protein